MPSAGPAECQKRNRFIIQLLQWQSIAPILVGISSHFLYTPYILDGRRRVARLGRFLRPFAGRHVPSPFRRAAGDGSFDVDATVSTINVLTIDLVTIINVVNGLGRGAQRLSEVLERRNSAQVCHAAVDVVQDGARPCHSVLSDLFVSPGARARRAGASG